MKSVSGCDLKEKADVELYTHDQCIQAQHGILGPFINAIADVHVWINPALVAQHDRTPAKT